MPLTEIADRVWTTPTGSTVVGGSAGVAVIGLPGSEAEVRALVADLDGLDAGPVVALVWTHGLLPRVSSTPLLRELLGPVAVHAHETAAEQAALHDSPEHADAVFSSVAVVELGDRVVELLHPGRGHSAGDLVAVVPGADVLVGGDLVAARDGVPAMGRDCFPSEWPLTLDLVLGLVGPATQVVPGRGEPVDRVAVEDQRDALGTLAEAVHDLAARGVAPADAVADPAADWPYPADRVHEAVRRAYEQLPPGTVGPTGQRNLPLA